MTDDSKLLRDYAKHGSEAAFGELVARYVDLVYSTALRQVNGDAHLAQDVTQSVFIDLARRAGALPTGVVLSGWLYRHTGFTASKVVRSEQRRRIREQEAVNMNALHTQPNTDAAWRQVAPVLDEAMQWLGARDRDAIVLRCFERRDLRAVGAALGTNEDAAQKRVSRALEKLRAFLSRRGITFSAAVLGTTISSQAVTAAPVGLAASVTGTALAGAAVGGGIALTLLKIMSMAKTKTAMVIAVAIATIIVLRWPDFAREKASNATQMNRAEAQPGNTKQDRPYVRRNSQTENSAKTPEAAKVRLMFHVVDAETGEGLANAKIHTAYFYAGGRPEGYDLVTDEAGSAAIPEPREVNDQGLNIFVTAEGHVPKSLGGNAAKNVTEYTMRLDRAQSVGGIVINEQGRPVEGVKIRVQGPGSKVGQKENIDFQTSAVTSDANGRWLCSYIPKDYEEIRFILTREDYAVTLPIVDVGTVDLMNLSLVIAPGFTVAGRITDKEGQPIAGASVKEVNNTGYRRQSTTTAVDGTFVIQGLRDSLQSLYFVDDRGIHDNPDQPFRLAETDIDLGVQAKGFASQRQTIHLVEPTNTVTITLVKGNIFRGRVQDEAGNPIPNTAVRTDSDNQGIRKYEWMTHTDADGKFEWDSAPEELVLFWFEADGYTVIRDLPLLADGSDHEIKLTRKPKSVTPARP